MNTDTYNITHTLCHEEIIRIANLLSSEILFDIAEGKKYEEKEANRQQIIASAPDGFSVSEHTDKYCGNHPEYGNSDETYFLALPPGTEVPEKFEEISHGSRGGDPTPLLVLPAGSLIRYEDSEEWEEVRKFVTGE